MASELLITQTPLLHMKLPDDLALCNILRPVVRGKQMLTGVKISVTLSIIF
jgi:hypothetical protein